MYKFVIICLALIIIGGFFLLRRYIKYIPILGILFSGIERLSISLGGTLAPITLLSYITIPIVLTKIDIRKEQFEKWLLISVLSLPLAAIFSIPFSSYRSQAIKSSIYFIIFTLFFFANYLLIRRTKNIYTLLYTVCISIGLFSLYALIQYVRFELHLYPDILHIAIPYSTSLTPLDFTIQNHTILRPNSGFNDVNTSAGFILLYLPCIAYLTFEKGKELIVKKKKESKKFFFIALSSFVLSIIAFALMRSRASLLSLAAMVIILSCYLFFKYEQIRKYILVAILFIIVVIAGVSLLHKNSIIERAVAVYNAEYSAQAHLTYTESALREFKQHPILGGGVGSFNSYFLIEQKAGLVGYHDSVDNPPLYIKVLAEEGIIGLLSLLLLHGYVLYKAFKYCLRKSVLYRFLILTLLCGFASLLFANFFHAYFTLYFSAIFLALFLGIIDSI